ncbi:MAG: hypothetical protein ABI651_01060 [Verrucomicrobiota bacterium]
MADSGNALDSVALGNGRFVIVGSGGAIVTSTNATDWVNESVPFSKVAKSITFAGGHFIAIADRLLYESSDGVRWTGHKTPIPNFNQGHAVAYGNGVFVGVGLNGTIASSTNLVDWRVDDVNSQSDFHAVTYDAGHFVAVGSSVVVSEKWLNPPAKSAGRKSTLRRPPPMFEQSTGAARSNCSPAASSGFTIPWKHKLFLNPPYAPPASRAI